MRRSLTPVALAASALLIAGCAGGDTADDEQATLARTGFSLTTASEEAQREFRIGLHHLDMGRFPEARAHFNRAVELDSAFALAHRFRAFTLPTTEASMAAFSAASAHKDSAAEAERLLIEITEAALENDAERQLELARQLTEAAPESPRAWMELAGVLAGMNRTEEAREALGRAIEADSAFVPAHMQLGNSYLFAEPLDRAAAQQSFERAVELAPEEAATHDLLGDAYRMQGKLEQAAAEYTRMAELDPDNALALQQRGHVHSFLGDFERARADYDSAIALGEDDEPATFAVYRSFVNVHEGQPEAAIAELDSLLARIDGMGLPDPRGPKIFALTSKAEIALHLGMPDVAEEALSRRAELVRANAAAVGTEQARRSTEASLELWQARVALERGQYERARTLVRQSMARVEPINDPTKHQGAHAVLGMMALERENFSEAAGHFEQAPPNDIYLDYHHALALEGAGRTEEARRLFEKVANWRFNALGLALVRSEAQAKVASTPAS